ncbi:MAG: amidohydrolase, partial [Alphaproteobacteria bacterium]|nr:amidohydrolase [Alphaproteobacteria bacterium]
MTRLLRNCFAYSADAEHRCIPDAAIRIAGGRIAWIGPRAAMPSGDDAEVLDLGGRVVMPGLINTHTHGGLGIHRGVCDVGDLHAWARVLAPHTSTLTIEDNRHGCELAVLEMLRNGITTACDCTRYGADIFSEVASAIGMRSLSGALANSPSLRAAGRPNWPLALEETKRAIAERGDDPLCRFYVGAHSPYNCTPELLIEIKRAADALGLPVVIHAAENRTEVAIVRERHGVSPIAHLDRLGLLDRRTLLAHCVWLDEADLATLARSGAGVSHNPISNAKLASGVAPVPAMRRHGIPVGLGTDSTLSNNALNIFQEMKAAALLQRATALDGALLDNRELLAMATREGARVLGWDDEIG